MQANATETGLQRGRVLWWRPKQGYGFIRPEHGPDVFVHFTAIDTAVHPKNLLADQIVEFETARGPKGPYATRVKVVVP